MKINNFLMLNVGYARHDSDWNFNAINSPFSRIYYVTEGKGYVYINCRKHILTPGNMYLIPAFTEHSDFCDGIFHHFYVHIYEDISGSQSIMENYDFPFEIPGQDCDRILFEELCRHNSSMALKDSNPKVYDNDNSLIESVRLSRMRNLYDRLESSGTIMKFISRFLKTATPKYQANDLRSKRPKLRHV